MDDLLDCEAHKVEEAVLPVEDAEKRLLGDPHHLQRNTTGLRNVYTNGLAKPPHFKVVKEQPDDGDPDDGLVGEGLGECKYEQRLQSSSLWKEAPLSRRDLNEDGGRVPGRDEGGEDGEVADQDHRLLRVPAARAEPLGSLEDDAGGREGSHQAPQLQAQGMTGMAVKVASLLSWTHK